MASIKFKARDEDATTGPVGGGGKFSAAPRGIYTLQIANHSEGDVTKSGKYIGTPITKMELEIADDGPEFGKKVWHNVTWIPRGSEEKPNPGHGIAVHFLHAIEVPCEGGEFAFEEADLQGRQFRALLEVDTYEKVGSDGKTYLNEKNYIREVYTTAHPEPGALPAPAEKKPQAAKPANGAPRPAVAAKAGNDGLPF